MLFNSVDFLIFFPIVVLVYFLVPAKLRCFWLLAASYFFYMCWNVKYILLILASTVVTWVCGRLIFRYGRWKKALLISCLVFNLGILFFFKYFNFFLDTCGKVLGKFGLTLPQGHFDILLPVGISFYTFQALSYTLDVYRGKIEPEKNFFRYALFVSF
ncbi:MAG TPA: membrane-bound O-acyltransferase family protein, partial [Lachnospiraceae bacterium]|nr:membrane-bound O-acyltransferase family protein [Lachnospiraceae bacterium]